MIISLKLIAQNSKKCCKKSLFLIPYFFTYLNVIFGFLSIIKAFESNFLVSALFIIGAALMDFIDGRLARAFDTCSGFGSELDSLADAISFCLAPAILVYSWFYGEIGFWSLVALSSYLCAGVARLAKFNTTKIQNNFIGLPTTFCAFTIANLVITYYFFDFNLISIILTKKIFLSIIFSLSLLMILPIEYVSLKSYKIKNFYDLLKINFSLFILIFLSLKKVPIILFLSFSYIFVGLFLFFINFLSRFLKK